MNLRLKTMHLLRQGWPANRRARQLALAAGTALLLLAAISCSNESRKAVVLPDVPGAKYIGSTACEDCHDEICKSFKTADHARLVAKGNNALGAGCESCHGPCSLHSDSGGDVKPPYSFASGRPQPMGQGARMPLENARAIETVCYNCHLDVRGQFNLPNHHPVPEGRLTCVQCHPPHGGIAMIGGGTRVMSEQDTCFQCHESQQTVYVFEHEAVREGCSSCHAPHGSVNAKLLLERDSNLCLKCHFQQPAPNGTGILIGGVDHSTKLSQGACWSAGCHEAVHGSQVSPTLRF